jgi:hypothetical protein
VQLQSGRVEKAGSVQLTHGLASSTPPAPVLSDDSDAVHFNGLYQQAGTTCDRGSGLSVVGELIEALAQTQQHMPTAVAVQQDTQPSLWGLTVVLQVMVAGSTCVKTMCKCTT